MQKNKPAFQNLSIRAKYQITIGLIALFCVAIRWLHSLAINYAPYSDMGNYLETSHHLWTTSPGAASSTLFPPGYSWLLWLYQQIGSLSTPRPILIIQGFLSGITLLFVAHISRHCFNVRTALLAASLYALYKSSVLFTGLMMSEILAELFLAAALSSFIMYKRSNNILYIVFCAAATSLAIHTRVNLAGVAVLFTVLLIWRSSTLGRERKRSALHVACYVLLTGASLLPWSIRNSIILHSSTFISANDGLNLLQGNNAYTDGGWFSVGDIPDEHIQAIAAQNNSSSKSKAYRKFAQDFIVQNPAYEMLYLVPQRFYYIYLAPYPFWPWGYTGESNFASHPFGPFIFIPLIPFKPLFVLGLIGFCIPARRHRFLPQLVWVTLLAPLLLVHGNPRFHYVSDFLLIICGSEVLRRIIAPAVFAQVFRFGWLAVCLTGSLGSALQSCRFGGPDILANSAGAATDSAAPAYYASVNPGTQSHLLLTADVAMRRSANAPTQPNVGIRFLNKEGKEVKKPEYAETLIPPYLLLNRDSQYHHFWRIVLVPGSAVTVQVTPNPIGGDIRNLRLSGPIW